MSATTSSSSVMKKTSESGEIKESKGPKTSSSGSSQRRTGGATKKRRIAKSNGSAETGKRVDGHVAVMANAPVASTNHQQLNAAKSVHAVAPPPPITTSAVAAAAAGLSSHQLVDFHDALSNTDGDLSEKNGVSDNENSEDEQVDHAPWDDIDLNPAVELVNKVIHASLEAGKTFNKSILTRTTQLLTGCDNVLMEIKNLSDVRDAARKKSNKKDAQDAACSCSVALSMLPNAPKVHSKNASCASSPSGDAKAGAVGAVPLDNITEDQTDRVLYKIEASMERLRELAEMVQATSMQGEANLIAKVRLPDHEIKSMGAAIQAAAAAATAAAISQERGRSSSAFTRLYSPAQVRKLQEWYYLYPRPLLDELTLMRTILNYRPYANPFLVNGLTIAHVRDWFKRRRSRERLRYVKLAIEAGREAAAAEEEIDLRIEKRIEQLRELVNPNELVKELDKVRAESSMHDKAVTSFSRNGSLESYVSASHATMMMSSLHEHGPNAGSSLRGKRSLKTQEMDVSDAIVVKVGNKSEISVLQNRIRSLLAQPRSMANTNMLQQTIDLLRSLDISNDVRIETGLVNDLKSILKVFTKPLLLRKSTIALIDSLGIGRRISIRAGMLTVTAPDGSNTKLRIDGSDSASGTANRVIAASSAAAAAAIANSAASTPTSTAPELSTARTLSFAASSDPALDAPAAEADNEFGNKREKRSKVLRPMKFSMTQVVKLEEWFQDKYKPTQEEMEEYLIKLNTAPLRHEKQAVDVNMTQLRRWFNKRRCLGRPPLALVAQSDATKEGGAGGDEMELAEDEVGAMEVDDGDDGVGEQVDVASKDVEMKQPEEGVEEKFHEQAKPSTFLPTPDALVASEPIGSERTTPDESNSKE